MVQVVVVDDEALVRSGFSYILDRAADIAVVAAVPGGAALAAVRDHRPDVVLLDIRMPDVDGLTLLREIRALPQPPVVAMLTTFDADDHISSALRSGAAGFLVKDTDPEQLPGLVRTLAGGGVVLSPKVARSVVAGYLAEEPDHASAGRVDELTEREREVLVLLAEGLPNADIGRRIHLGTGTIKDHVSAILTKLGVQNRVQAALLAERAGLLDPGGGCP